MSDALKHIRIAPAPGASEAEAAEQPTGGGAAGLEGSLEQRAIAVLKTIYDPEIPVNIYELGLIYRLDVNEADGVIDLEMTLTAPGCPVAQTFPGTVEGRLREIEGVEEVTVRLVWDPPWTQERMTEAARLQLGLL